MKTKISRPSKLVAGITGSALVLACWLQSAQSEPPKDGPAPAQPPPVAGDATNSPPAQAEHNVIQTVPPAKPPPDVKISPALAELIKLVEAGVGEEVILAFINNSPNTFQLTSAEILYLNDLGVSANVITAMMRTGGVQANSALAAGAQPPPPTNAVPAPPPVTTAAAPAPIAPEVAPAAPPLTATYVTTTTPYYPVAVATPVYEPQAVNYYYESLAPYGSWIEIAGYGWCWQPTVAVVDYSWRPYCNRGRWIYSNCGWYWLSDYSWGWAPFHYGRWYQHAGAGWVWTPGTVWGPAWVSWRYADSYCGWAPLPPEAHFATGVGFSYYGSHVGASFDFGLHPHHYTFIPTSRFSDYNPSRHSVSSTHVKNVYKDSTVINNYIVGNNNTIVNEGIGANRVAAATKSNIRPVQIREHSPSAGRVAKPEILDRDGSQLVVYRPSLPKQSARVSETLASRATPTRTEDVRAAARTGMPSLARTDLGRSAPVAAPTAETAPNRSRFTPDATRGSSSLPRTTDGQAAPRGGGRLGTPLPRGDQAAGNRGTPSVTPPAPAPPTPQTQTEPRRAPTFFVRRANGSTTTIQPPTAAPPNNSVTVTGGDTPQPQARGNSLPSYRSAPESSPRPRSVAPSPEVNRLVPEPSRSPVVTQPQSARVETASPPRLIPNYSPPPQAAPTPSYQPPVRERPAIVSPAVQPQYRAPQTVAPQYVAPQHVAPQPPRVETRAPERSSPPPAAQSAPSHSSRSEPAPSSSSKDRSDRGR